MSNYVNNSYYLGYGQFSAGQLQELSDITTYEDTALGIMRWGIANAFPQTLINLIDKSPNGKPVVDRTAKFLAGGQFDGYDMVINPQGTTLGKLVSLMAQSYATFEAFSMQTNYNIKGEVAGINPMKIETLRFNRFDELDYASMLGFHRDFGRNDVVKKNVETTISRGNIKWFHKFNPGDAMFAQLESHKKEGKKYEGQILYYSNQGASRYPIPPLQSAINFLLSDVENSVLMRKETSTGFISSYLLKTVRDSEDATLQAFLQALEGAMGARGSGKVITLSSLSPEEVQNTLLEEIGSGAAGASAIVDAVEKAHKINKDVISNVYLIPPVLAGRDVAKGLSTGDLQDAYAVFNSITQEGRNKIQGEINRILAVSNFERKQIQLVPLELALPTSGSNITPTNII